jgi:peptidoglycan lytic transglycosylase
VDVVDESGAASRGRLGVLTIAMICGMIAACAARPPASAPLPPIPGSSLVGIASWYGPGFNGHRTSSGEVYNQEDLTAASTLFPLDTHIMVTNLSNGRAVEVAINDHGPYTKGRMIDLSYRAARVLGMIGPGTTTVRMDVLSTPPNGAALIGREAYFVQVGSFSYAANAERLRARLAHYFTDVRIESVEAGANRYYRVRMGAFASQRAAEQRARSASQFGLPVVIVEE